MKIGIITAFIYFVILAAGAGSAGAATCTVNALTDTGAGSGLTGDLRYCIAQTNAAPGADVIGVGVAGTVLLNSNLPVITDSLTINGPGQSFFIVDAQNGADRRGFEIDAPAGVVVTLRNLTIRRGNIVSNGIGSGGGIALASGATLNLDFVTVADNTSVDGGAGVSVNASTLNVTNSRFAGNNATGPGAGGGAIFFFNGGFFMSTTTVSGNSAANGGAFAFVFVNPARVENSTISGNTAAQGGGFYNAASTVRMSNVTLSGNAAASNGGGFVNASSNGSVTLRNSTVAANRAATGGGFYNYGGTNISTTIANTIVADNAAVNGPDVFNNFSGLVLGAGANIVETGIAGSGGVGGGSFSQVDPRLLPLAGYGGATATHNFAPNSPARDAGVGSEALDTSSNPLTLDQRGGVFGRVAGGAVDIGAYEFASVVVTKTADTNDGVCDADCSLREAVAAAPNGANVEFSALFDTPQTIVLGSLVNIPKSLTIFGPGADKLTVSGGNATTLFENFSASAASINFVGMTFADGNGVGGNNGNQGGAVELHGTAASFDRVVFRDNSATAIGGAMLCMAALCRISNSSFYNNSAPGASVLYGGSGTTEIVNSTFSGNTETAGGYGALYLRGSVVIRNSTLAGNSGFSHLYLSTELATLALANTIVGGGTTTDIYRAGGTVTSGGGNLLGRNANAGPAFAAAGAPNASLDFVGTSAAPVNPLLAPLGNYGGPTPTRAPLPGSPALDNGIGCVVDNSCAPSIAAALTADQRGAPRLIGAAVDSGAVETNVTIEPATLPNGNTIQAYNQQLAATRLTGFAGNLFSKQTAAFAPADFALVPVAGQMLPPGVTLSAGGLLAGMPTAGGTYTFTVRATDSDGAAGVRQYTVQILVPTAAGVSVSGRVATAGGNGIANARVVLTDSRGNSRTVSTGTFGYYFFDDVAVGETYVVTVVSKRYSFAPRAIAVADAVADLNFAAAE